MWPSIFVFLTYVIVAHAQRVVDTEYGEVRGHAVNVDNGREQTVVDVFYAIPFAKAPIGALRFAAPQKADPWTDIFEADTLGTACPQSGNSLRGSVPGWNDIGEDCLNLNIFTPTDGTGPFPVMVWIYGGAYQVGANMQFPGHFLASRGVVVAVINYRLNKFGFSYTGNAACPGNAGMLDQAMGLQFVVDNIANFGGDPAKITLFGESAGGSSTSLHLLSPLSNALFQQAIIQSGFEMNFWTINSPDTIPEDYTRQIAEQLDCIRPDDYQMMDCLRDLDWQELFLNASIRCTTGYNCNGMAPVVDGAGGFLPQEPQDLRASGDVMGGAIMSGICREDGSSFTSISAPLIGLDDCCNRTYFTHVLENRMVGFYDVRITNETADDLYHAMDYMYTPWPRLDDHEANRDRLVDIITDSAFGVAWDRQLKDHWMMAPTYGYVFDHIRVNSSYPEWMGTPHGADVSPVFGFPLLDFNQDVLDDCGMRAGNFTQYDYDYSIFIQELWTNFAKTGNPTPSPVNNPLGGTTVWTPFTFDDMNVMYLGDESINIEKGWLQKEYAYWNHYLITIAGKEMGIDDEWPEYAGYNDVTGEDWTTSEEFHEQVLSIMEDTMGHT